MPAFGVSSTFGISGTAGYVQESSSEVSKEEATIRDQNGVTVKAQLKPLQTTTISIKAKGDATLSAVVSGDITSGTATIISAKTNQTNDDFPTLDITAVSYT